MNAPMALKGAFGKRLTYRRTAALAAWLLCRFALDWRTAQALDSLMLWGQFPSAESKRWSSKMVALVDGQMLGAAKEQARAMTRCAEALECIRDELREMNARQRGERSGEGESHHPLAE
jgi:hypothetical protein